VVKEEKRQRYDNVPYGNALIDIYAAIFPKDHPYHHATIGSMEDLDAASVQDVHEFFRATTDPTTPCSHWSVTSLRTRIRCCRAVLRSIEGHRGGISRARRAAGSSI